MMTPALEDSVIALYDIDANRLNESKLMLDTINQKHRQLFEIFVNNLRPGGEGPGGPAAAR